MFWQSKDFVGGIVFPRESEDSKVIRHPMSKYEVKLAEYPHERYPDWATGVYTSTSSKKSYQLGFQSGPSLFVQMEGATMLAKLCLRPRHSPVSRNPSFAIMSI